MADGKLIFDTSLDDSGVVQGMKGLSGKLTGIAGGIAAGVGVAAAAVAAAGVAAVKFGIEFESAFAGVKKTVDATDAEFEMLKNGILDMSSRMPQTASEIAGVAEAAGQLGIEVPNILGFTETMVMLGDATNLSSEQAATALARFANITQMSQGDFDRLGSTIVELGNNFATTESEIVDMAMRLAGTGAQVGMTESDIMALSATMSSLGLNAEAAGSSMSRSMQKMNSAVISAFQGVKEETEHFNKVFEGTGVTVEQVLEAYAKGDEALQQLANTLGGDWDVQSLKEVGDQFDAVSESAKGFADVAGMTATEFIAVWQEKPIEAIAAFAKGLAKIKEEGGDVTQTLKDLNITSTQEIDTWNRLAGAGDLLVDAMVMAQEAWDENTALMTEAQARYSTTESQLLMLKNAFINLGIAMSDELVPMVNESVQAIKGEVNNLAEIFKESGFEGFAEALGESLAKGVDAIASVLPDFINAGTQILNSLVEGLNTNMSSISESALKIVTSLVSGIGSLAVNLAELGLTLITELLKGFTEGGSELASIAQETVQSLITVFQEKLPEILEIGRGILENLVNGIVENLPAMSEAASELILGLATSFGENIPGLMEVGLQIVVAIADAIIAAVPNLIQAGLEIITGIVQGIMDSLPTLIEEAPRIINEFASAIYGAIPDLLKTGLEIIGIIAKGLIEAIPTLIANIPQILLAIVNAFTLYNWATMAQNVMAKIGTGLKDFGSKTLPEVGKNLMEVLGKAIEGALNFVKTAAETVGKGLIEAIKTFISGMKTSGGELIKSLADGVTGGGDGVVQAGKTIITNLISGIKTFLSQMLNSGLELIKSAASGVTQGGSNVVTAGKTVITNVISAIKGFAGQFVTVGADLIAGIGRGIAQGAGAVVEAAKSLGGKILSGIQSRLQIKSPSRVMRDEVGVPIVEGLMLGIEQSEHLIIEGMQKIGDTMLEKMVQNHEHLTEAEKQKVLERFEKMKQLNMTEIGAAYESYKLLHTDSVREIEEEIEAIEEEIAKAKKDKKQKHRLEELEVDKEQKEQLKKNLEDFGNHFTETYEKMVAEYEKAMEKIEQKTAQMADKLKSYGDVIEVVRDAEGNVIKDQYGNEMLKLTDLEQQIRQIANYGSLLETLEARGADIDVMSKMVNMSVDEAVKYGQLLMQQSDSDWDRYMAQMETKRNLANNIAQKYYQKEMETLKKEYTDKLTENLEEITGKAGEVGQDSAKELAEGFKSNSNIFIDSVKDVIQQMDSLLQNEVFKSAANARSMLMQEMNAMQAAAIGAAAAGGGMVINAYGADYSNLGQARDFGRELGNEVNREIRRNGGY